jgi:hypothetical protein
LEKLFDRRVVNAGNDIAGLEARQKAALDNPVSVEGSCIKT